ncbi:MAG TPA: Fe-S-containing protein [Candidatus Acidoferrales bacterium]|nr:Fe-S-containing protein [Candidatus Acidoferrales bacterium]
MLSALLLALREGVEAALVVGIVLVYLNRTGRRQLARYVWAGVGLAVACSFAAAVFLQRWQISEDGFEGVLMLAAAALVVSMIIWMNRIARRLRKEIEQRIENYAQRGERAAGWGIGFFVFLMVLREGAELILILRAVELSIAGLQVWIGTGIGIALAVAVGLFFFQGTLKIPLGRFFAATSTILMVVAFQLGLTGLHELSEATWIPSSRQEMATIGPIVRNEYFFFVVILGVAAIVVLREWFALHNDKAGSESSDAGGKTGGSAANPAEKRLKEHEHRRRRGWSFAAAFLCLAVILSLTAEFVYTRASAAPPEAEHVVAVGNIVRIPLAEMSGVFVHFYSVDVQGTAFRFFVIRKANGDYVTALDACQICGRIGYRQEGSMLICRNCGAPVNAGEIGSRGGCNPIAFKSNVEGKDIVADLSAMTDAATQIEK